MLKIGIEEGLDESSSDGGLLDSYGELFSGLRDAEFDMIEIGGRDANRARMWRRFFTRANIFIVSRSPAEEIADLSGVAVLRPAEFDQDSLLAILAGLRPRLVIDDGTHGARARVQALNAIIPLLAGGGHYVLEGLREGQSADCQDNAADDPISNALVTHLVETLMGEGPAGTSVPTLAPYVAPNLDEVSVRQNHIILRKRCGTGPVLRRAHVDEFPRSSDFQEMEVAPYPRLHAKVYGANNYIARKFENLVAEGIVQMPPARTACLQGATVAFGGVVMDLQNDGLIAAESLNCIQNLRESPAVYKVGEGRRWWGKRSFDSPVRFEAVPGRQHILLKSPWDANYGHWLYDSLARIRALDGFELRGKPLFVVDTHSGPMADVIKDSLSLAGVGADDFIRHDFRYDAWFESVVVPGLVSRHPDQKAPEATEFLEGLADGADQGKPKRIYLTRNAYSRRRLKNEDELWPLFESNGFERIATETLSLREQISFFSNADIIAGNMGAAFSSLAFCKPGIKVLTLATEAMPHDFFYDIVCHKEGAYVGVQGRAVDSPAGMASDFVIDKSLLESAFEELLD